MAQGGSLAIVGLVRVRSGLPQAAVQAFNVDVNLGLLCNRPPVRVLG